MCCISASKHGQQDVKALGEKMLYRDGLSWEPFPAPLLERVHEGWSARTRPGRQREGGSEAEMSERDLEARPYRS